MKKTLGVLLAAPFAIAVLAFAGITVLENLVAVDITGIRWNYRDQEAFRVSTEGYLLEAEATYNPDLELSEGNNLVWNVTDLDNTETDFASIEVRGEDYYLLAQSEGEVRLTCQNEKGTVSRSFNALIYENGAIVINDENAPSSGRMVSSLRRYGQYDFNGTGQKENATISLDITCYSDVPNDSARLISSSSNLSYENGVVTLLGEGEAYLTFALTEMEFIEQTFSFEIISDAVNVYDYDDLLLATNLSQEGEKICLQRNLLSSSSTYVEDEQGNLIEEYLEANTRLFGHYDFSRQEMSSFSEDVYRFATTYPSSYIAQYVAEEEGNDAAIYQQRMEVLSGIHVQQDFYGNGFTISLDELTYPHHGEVNSYTGILSPGEEDLFKGPLTFVSIGLFDAPVMKAFGQDNSGMYIEGDNILVDDLRIQNTDDTNNLYNLEYTGSVIDTKGSNITISNSFIRNGRNGIRIMDGEGFLLDNCLVENTREFLLKIGSDEFVPTNDEETLTLSYGAYQYKGSIADFMDMENGLADTLIMEALSDAGFALSALPSLNAMQEALDGDISSLTPYELTIRDSLFGRCGILSIAFDSLFNGPYLYNGVPSLVSQVMSMLPDAPSFLPNKIGGASYPSHVSVEGDTRFYDWKDGESIDASCLIEERLGELLSGLFEERLPIDSYFPLKNLLLREAENGYSYTYEETSYVCPVAGFYGGGVNLSSLTYEEGDLGEEILIDFARACVTGDGLAENDNPLAQVLARCVPLASGFHPFRFYLTPVGEETPSTFNQSPDVSLIYARGGSI